MSEYKKLLKQNNNYEEYMSAINDVFDNKFKIQIDKIVKNEEVGNYLKGKILAKNEVGFPIQYSEKLILFQKNKRAYKIIIPLTIFFYLFFFLFLLGIPGFFIKIITFSFTDFMEFLGSLVVLVLVPMFYFGNVIGEYMSKYVFAKNKLKAILFPFNKVGRDYIYTVLFTKGLTFTQNNYTYDTSVLLYKNYNNFDDLIKYNQDLSKLDTKTLKKLKELYLDYKKY